MGDDTGKTAGSRNRWNPAEYDGDHGFVAEYGRDIVGVLDPQPGERILDLGCGTGHLTADIAADVGPEGTVVGIDQSAAMIGQAREAYPDLDFRVADAREFDHEADFDAVFSNAALHWIPEQAAVVATVADLLEPGGRFVAEMGGSGNVGTIVSAVREVCARRGHEVTTPWYFPTVGEQASLLESHGFEVTDARLFDRPTDLDGADGLANWLDMFGDSLFAGLTPAQQEGVVEAVCDRLRERLYDDDRESWTADYRRLRFVAVVPDGDRSRGRQT